MELWQVPVLFSRLPMFPFFDLAHYVASVMALKEQRGERPRGRLAGRGGARSFFPLSVFPRPSAASPSRAKPAAGAGQPPAAGRPSLGWARVAAAQDGGGA